MKIGSDKQNSIFKLFLFFKEISQNTRVADHCFIWLTNYIKVSIRFKFHPNPMKNMVKTEFHIFLLEEILILENPIFSIKNFNSAREKFFLHFQKHFPLSNWIWQRKVFFDFSFSHFPCKIKILNRHGSSSNEQK